VNRLLTVMVVVLLALAVVAAHPWTAVASGGSQPAPISPAATMIEINGGHIDGSLHKGIQHVTVACPSSQPCGPGGAPPQK
jgi:hypothetical protein